MSNLSRKVIAMKFSNTINLYKNKYSSELLNLIPKFFCKSTSRILINDMMDSDVITRHKYCIPVIEEKNENKSNFRENFNNIYSQSWITITKNLGKPKHVEVTRITKHNVLPSLKQYKKQIPRFVPKPRRKIVRRNVLKQIPKIIPRAKPVQKKDHHDNSDS